MRPSRSRARTFGVMAVVLVSLVACGAAAGATDPKPRAVGVADLSEPDFEVFMDVGASRRQIADVRRGLLSGRGTISRFAYLDKRVAYAEFRRLFADDPALVAKTAREDLPVSFRIELIAPERDATMFLGRVEGLPGVDAVVARSTAAGLAEARRRARLPECGGDPAIDAEAYLAVDATQDDEQRVEAALRALPGVVDVRYVSHDEALRRFACIFQSEESIDAARASGLPVSFQLVFAAGASETETVQAIGAIVGPENVAHGQDRPDPERRKRA